MLRRSQNVIIFVIVLMLAVSGNSFARAKGGSASTQMTPRIADEPYVMGSGAEQVEAAEKRLEQGSCEGGVCKPPKSDDSEEGEDLTDETKTPKPVLYGVGIAGGGFIKNAGLGAGGMTGAYSFFEYRFSKIFSVDFNTYGGYLFGNGRFYYSALNLGARMYPMAYSNPNLEFFIDVGGHALDMITNNDTITGTAFGQGGYGGVGVVYRPKHGMFGLSVMGRVSTLWMDGPVDGGGGGKKRRLSMPAIGIVSIVL